IEWRVAGGQAGRGVTGRIALPDIRLDFDDDAAGDEAARAADEDLAEQIARDGERGALVEVARQNHGRGSPRRATARVAARATPGSASCISGRSSPAASASPERPRASASPARTTGSDDDRADRNDEVRP